MKNIREIYETKINLSYIKRLNACSSGIERYIKDGNEDFNGNISEFLELDSVNWNDKKWVVFHEDQNILSDDLMREFAFICSLRAVETVEIMEITYLYDMNLLGYVSNYAADSTANYAANSTANSTANSAAYYAANSTAYYTADSAAYSAADYAADYAADSAADYAAEENIQRDILLNLIEFGTTLKQGLT